MGKHRSGFENNCVFIGEDGFQINMKRSLAWPRKGGSINVKTPSTRGKMTTIIGSISLYGVVNIKVKTPRVIAPSKKRKDTSGESTAGKGKGGTVTGHYVNFVAIILNVMDKW